MSKKDVKISVDFTVDDREALDTVNAIMEQLGRCNKAFPGLKFIPSVIVTDRREIKTTKSIWEE